MSDDNEVQVKFSAEIAGLLDGLNEGQEALKQAAEGMQGNLGALAKSFEALGPAALAAGAAFMGLEALKEVAEDFFETTERCNELTEAYKELNITAGMSADDFSTYNAAVTMAGGSASDLETITQGMQRGIKSNSEVLIANGIAADRASLSHMTLGQYIARVVEVMDTYGSATDKDQLLMEAFGRSGMKFAQTLREMNEHMGKAQDLAAQGGPINQAALDMLEQAKEATSRLKLAQEEYDNIVAQNAAPLQNAWKNLKADLLESKIASEMALQAMHQGLIQVQLDAVTGDLDIKKITQEYKDFLATQKEVSEGSMDAGAHYGPQDRSTASNISQQDLAAKKEASKQAAEEAKRQAKEAAEEALRIAKTETAEEIKIAKDKFAAIKELGRANVTTGKQTPNEAVADEIRGLEMVHAAETAANAQMIVAAKGKKAELAKINAEQADEDRKLILETQALEDQQIKNALEARRKAEEADAKSREENARKTEELVKQTAEAEIKAADDAYKGQNEALQALEMGRERLAAAETAAVNQELAAKLAAIEKERQALEKLNVNTQSLLAKEVALTQEAENKKLGIKLEAEKKADASYMAMMNKATANWDVGIQKMLHGEMTLSQGIRNATRQWGDEFERACINMGLQWVKSMALQLLTSRTAHESQNMMDAKDAFAGAYKATVGIPFVGPVLAPIAGGAAFAAVLAFAEDGFDIGNYNPVTQLHAKEMVLPADLAEGVRTMVRGGGGGASGGGSSINIHNHGVIDAGAWFQKNQGAMMRSINDAMTNRRRS